ncbi:hypothetical protein D3C79_981160 [compost metagenome]
MAFLRPDRKARHAEGDGRDDRFAQAITNLSVRKNVFNSPNVSTQAVRISDAQAAKRPAKRRSR